MRIMRIVAVSLMVIYCVVMAVKFYKLTAFAVIGKRYDYSDEERARGVHCSDYFRESDSPLSVALKERLGTQIDKRVSLSLQKAEVGPLRKDGTHALIVLYYIDSVGRLNFPAKKAIGTLVNSDCSVNLTVFQR